MLKELLNTINQTLPTVNISQFIGGDFCGTPGSPNVDGECLAGHYCTSGVDTSTPTDSVSHKGTGAECPTGHYCPKGSTVPLPCEAGTYALTTGILAFSYKYYRV